MSRGIGGDATQMGGKFIDAVIKDRWRQARMGQGTRIRLEEGVKGAPLAVVMTARWKGKSSRRRHRAAIK